MSMLAQYFEGIREEFRYFPAWPPNAPYQLGDVGQVVDGAFVFLTTLKALGIPFETLTGEPGRDMSHTSHESVTFRFKAAGQTLQGTSLPVGKAGVQVEFKSAGAFVFQASGTTIHRIKDQYALSRAILTRFRKKTGGGREWSPDWFVVTELVTAKKVTVLISNSNSASIDLVFDGAVPAGPVPLAAASVGLTVERQSGQVTSVLAEAEVTPLIGLKRVKRGLLGILLGRDDWAEFAHQAGADLVPGLPADLLEVPTAAEWIPVKDGAGRPTRYWRPRPQTPPPPSQPGNPAEEPAGSPPANPNPNEQKPKGK